MASMFFAAPPPPPISFSREIAPIMAMHCNGCHGAASGLTTRSYRELMLGGNLGKSVVPNDPKRSLLLDFLEGRRGERHRMPKDGRPLSEAQIAVIRRWIEQGAKNDNLEPKAYRLVRSGVPVEGTRVTRVLCRVNTTAYVTVIAKDPSQQTVLWTEVASLKSPKEGNDAGEPGATLCWELRAGVGWPKTVNLELTVQYATEKLSDIEFRTYMLEPGQRAADANSSACRL
jgi:hypothetical protein